MITRDDGRRQAARLCLAMAIGAAMFAAAGCRDPQPAGPNAPAQAVTPPEAQWVECVPGEAGEWVDIHGEGPAGWDAAAGLLRIPRGEGLAGVRWTGAPPVAPFEVELEARRTNGHDFFCGLTVPTRSTRECVTLIVGGWGGELVGISSLDDRDASENETARTKTFEPNRWYRIRLRFGDEHLAAWIDDQQLIDTDTTHRRLSLRYGPIDACAPFGLATWETGAELRSVRWRPAPPTR